MLICALIITFFSVAVTGPAGVEWLEAQRWYQRRRARRLGLDDVGARVVYLPSGACRSPSERASWPGGPLDAIE